MHLYSSGQRRAFSARILLRFPISQAVRLRYRLFGRALQERRGPLLANTARFLGVKTAGLKRGCGR